LGCSLFLGENLVIMAFSHYPFKMSLIRVCQFGAVGFLMLSGMGQSAAQSEPTGISAAPPVASNSQPDLPAQLDGRRDIRGCTVTSNCTRTADLLRDFELEAFGPAAKGIDGPWAPDVQAPKGHLLQKTE
jgi:hypothetical protein